jgi:hypothetical protein
LQPFAQLEQPVADLDQLVAGPVVTAEQLAPIARQHLPFLQTAALDAAAADLQLLFGAPQLGGQFDLTLVVAIQLELG